MKIQKRAAWILDACGRRDLIVAELGPDLWPVLAFYQGVGARGINKGAGIALLPGHSRCNCPFISGRSS